MAEEDKKKSSCRQIEEAALQGAAVERIGRFGSAVQEHFVSFGGVDRESGTVAKRSLYAISKYKRNSVRPDISDKQQAGFSAEVKAAARANAKAIIDGKSSRTTRTDDMAKTVDRQGRAIGGTNDQLFDLAEVDASGVLVEGTQRQLKFVGEDAKECAARLLQGKYDKYRDHNVPIEIPKDFYKEVHEELDKKIAGLNEQIRQCKERGNLKAAEAKKAELAKVQKTKDSLRQSSVKSDEALFARSHPGLSTAKDVVGVAARAGLYQAGTGAIISGSVSLVRNTVACMKGEKEPQTAALEVLGDTGKGAVFSYATAFTGTVAKGAMQNASSEYVRALSNTGLSSCLVSTTVHVGKTMSRFLRGEISGTECVVQLGEQGFGELGSAMYSTAAVAVVSGTGSVAASVVAGMLGSTLGYAAATAVYKELSTALQEYDLAREERMRIEAECKEAVELICQYRREMNEAVEEYFTEHLSVFSSGFAAMDQAILESDADGFIAGNVQLQELLGHEVQFSNPAEFDELMLSDDAFKL